MKLMKRSSVNRTSLFYENMYHPGAFILNAVKNLFVVLVAVAFLSSCGTKKKNDEKAATDSTAAKVATPVDELTEKIKADLGNPELYSTRAKYYLAEKKFTPAMNDINKAISIDSTKADYFLTMANIHFATMNIPKSEEAFQKAISIDNKNIEAYLKLAEMYLYLKKYKESIQNANEALKVDPHLAKAYFLKGYVMAESGDTSRAISNYQTCVEQEPAYYDAFMQLGLIYSRRLKPLAVEYLNKALALRPSSTEVIYARGLFYQESGDIDRAVADYNKILEIDPNYKDAYYNLGYIEVNYRKNYQKGIEFFTKAIEKDKYYAQAFYNRGYCYEMLGDKQKAMADYKSALENAPKYDMAIKGMKRIGA
jgi:tetratricopeptide (TPR) repeat protein